LELPEAQKTVGSRKQGARRYVHRLSITIGVPPKITRTQNYILHERVLYSEPTLRSFRNLMLSEGQPRCSYIQHFRTSAGVVGTGFLERLGLLSENACLGLGASVPAGIEPATY
jgi:hypothetical protein